MCIRDRIIGTSDFPTGERLEFEERVRFLIDDVASNSDTLRERAAADEVGTRWLRYVITSEAIADAIQDGGEDGAAQARLIAINEGNRDFNGFNTAVEALLLSNRDQFDGLVASAENRLNFISLGLIALPLLAVLFVLAGYQPRINEYW